LDRRNKRLQHRAANFSWMPFNLLLSADVIEFHTTEAYSSLDPIRAIIIRGRREKIRLCDCVHVDLEIVMEWHS
jgi:hypothetical protein